MKKICIIFLAVIVFFCVFYGYRKIQSYQNCKDYLSTAYERIYYSAKYEDDFKIKKTKVHLFTGKLEATVCYKNYVDFEILNGKDNLVELYTARKYDEDLSKILSENEKIEVATITLMKISTNIDDLESSDLPYRITLRLQKTKNTEELANELFSILSSLKTTAYSNIDSLIAYAYIDEVFCGVHIIGSETTSVEDVLSKIAPMSLAESN